MVDTVAGVEERSLVLRVHGRVLEHLGIQMYASPVNALAELVANAWDADAEKVEITHPDAMGQDREIVVKDDGIGMTYEECQNRYLYVGWNRRGGEPEAKSALKERRVLGRKGIGKFAGFGIADVIRVSTVSLTTGEKTVFDLSINELTGQDYIGTAEKKIAVVEYLAPDSARIAEHGTTISLRRLRLTRRIRSDFPTSMARRFIILQRQMGFSVTVNGEALPDAVDLSKAQYIFPRDYEESERPENLDLKWKEIGKTQEQIDEEARNGWGLEYIGSHTIKWRVMFHTEPLDEEELRGISVFAHGKVVQAPFLFQLTGGLGGQHGVEYLTGQVEADYLDAQAEDIVTTERQRVNWDHAAAESLLKWGQERVKSLLKIWKSRRSETRRKQIEDKLAGFSDRLKKLPRSEQNTIRSALMKLGSIETLGDEQFDNLGSAILTAWEQGRLKTLIDNMATADNLTVDDLLGLFAEMDVLTALNVAEAIETRILAVGELQRRLETRDLENEVRDYLAEHPYLIAPEYQTFKVERSLRLFLDEMAGKSDIPTGAENKRVDMVLTSGSQLVLFEFMRPGLPLDWDHLQRYELYFRTIRSALRGNSAGPYYTFTGYVIADSIDTKAAVMEKVQALEQDGMLAQDWRTLVHRAFKMYEEYFDALANRNPSDERIKAIARHHRS